MREGDRSSASPSRLPLASLGAARAGAARASSTRMIGFSFAALDRPDQQHARPRSSASSTALFAVMVFLIIGRRPAHDRGARARATAPIPVDARSRSIDAAHREHRRPRLAQVFVIGLEIAAPVARSRSSSSTRRSALVARAVPQMNVFVVGLPAKILVGFAVDRRLAAVRRRPTSATRSQAVGRCRRSQTLGARDRWPTRPHREANSQAPRRGAQEGPGRALDRRQLGRRCCSPASAALVDRRRRRMLGELDDVIARRPRARPATPDLAGRAGLGALVDVGACCRVLIAAAPIAVAALVAGARRERRAGAAASITRAGAQAAVQHASTRSTGLKRLFGVERRSFERGKAITKTGRRRRSRRSSPSGRSCRSLGALVGIAARRRSSGSSPAMVMRARARRRRRAARARRRLDFVWQRHQHEKSLKMTKEEVKQEARQTDIAPEVRGAIRRRQFAAAPAARMLADVADRRRRRHEPDPLRGRAALRRHQAGAGGGREGRRPGRRRDPRGGRGARRARASRTRRSRGRSTARSSSAR